MQTPDSKHLVYISLGSNLGDKKYNLEKAVNKIAERAGSVSAISSIYETEPWGYESPNTFFNMVIRLESTLSPTQLLKLTQDIELEMGRTKKSIGSSYQDRIIDIDIILYDDLIMETQELILPHPYFHKRKFVLEPLFEIDPELIHPVLGISIKEILQNI